MLLQRGDVILGCSGSPHLCHSAFRVNVGCLTRFPPSGVKVYILTAHGTHFLGFGSSTAPSAWVSAVARRPLPGFRLEHGSASVGWAGGRVGRAEVTEQGEPGVVRDGDYAYAGVWGESRVVVY